MRKSGQPARQSRRPMASISGVTLIVMFGWLSQAHADPISIPVMCQGETVGTIDVDVKTVLDSGKTWRGWSAHSTLPSRRSHGSSAP